MTDRELDIVFRWSAIGSIFGAVVMLPTLEATFRGAVVGWVCGYLWGFALVLRRRIRRGGRG